MAPSLLLRHQAMSSREDIFQPLSDGRLERGGGGNSFLISCTVSDWDIIAEGGGGIPIESHFPPAHSLGNLPPRQLRWGYYSQITTVHLPIFFHSRIQEWWCRTCVRNYMWSGQVNNQRGKGSELE